MDDKNPHGCFLCNARQNPNKAALSVSAMQCQDEMYAISTAGKRRADLPSPKPKQPDGAVIFQRNWPQSIKRPKLILI